jgi:light-regulated signal transduction histidine kinase (bacteriophytochrome)
MIGLANKQGGYETSDLEAIEALSLAFVEALMRVRAEVAVRGARDELEVRVQERTVELARSNAELEQYAYVASHDLREPLRMLSSFVQLLAERYRGKLDADANGLIDSALDEATRMQTLIRDLLTYSRVGRAGKPLEPVSSEEVLDRVVHDLRQAIEESGGRVTHDPLPTVRADETQLGELFQNLVGNALKFRRAEPPEAHISAALQESEWLFSVRDNGIGLDMQHRDRIFMMFQRLHTRQEYPGTGIGLALCKKIVERHGGRIWVESKPGQGSTFHFTLPLRAGKAH